MRIGNCAAGWLAGVGLLGCVAFTGCSKGASTVEVTIDSKGLAGNWVEFVEKPKIQDPRIVAPPDLRVIRKVTFNDDGTFAMTLHDKRGKVIEGARVSGTWTLEPRYIEMTPNENTFKGEDAGLAPTQCSGVYTTPDGVEQLLIYSENGWQGQFKRE